MLFSRGENVDMAANKTILEYEKIEGDDIIANVYSRKCNWCKKLLSQFGKYARFGNIFKINGQIHLEWIEICPECNEKLNKELSKIKKELMR